MQPGVLDMYLLIEDLYTTTTAQRMVAMAGSLDALPEAVRAEVPSIKPAPIPSSEQCSFGVMACTHLDAGFKEDRVQRLVWILKHRRLWAKVSQGLLGHLSTSSTSQPFTLVLKQSVSSVSTLSTAHPHYNHP